MFDKLKKALKRLHNDEAGAMKIEMILILILIAIPLLIVLVAFRKKIIGYFDNAQSELDGMVDD